MEKVDYFKKEYEYIKDVKKKEDIKYLVSNLPDYFFEIPASSTGKYHPDFALGNGGLVRHTKVAVRIAYELLNNPGINNFTDEEKDLIIMALLLHDGFKCGKVKEKYTRMDHPLLAASFVRENKDKLSLSEDEVELLYNMISSHMGIWNKDFDNNEVTPIPKDKYQRFVHMCDYLASRKVINVSFNGNDISN